MEIWKFEMTSTGESLGDVSVRIGIVQGDSLLLYLRYVWFHRPYVKENEG